MIKTPLDAYRDVHLYVNCLLANWEVRAQSAPAESIEREKNFARASVLRHLEVWLNQRIDELQKGIDDA